MQPDDPVGALRRNPLACFTPVRGTQQVPVSYSQADMVMDTGGSTGSCATAFDNWPRACSRRTVIAWAEINLADAVEQQSVIIRTTQAGAYRAGEALYRQGRAQHDAGLEGIRRAGRGLPGRRKGRHDGRAAIDRPVAVSAQDLGGAGPVWPRGHDPARTLAETGLAPLYELLKMMARHQDGPASIVSAGMGGDRRARGSAVAGMTSVNVGGKGMPMGASPCSPRSPAKR